MKMLFRNRILILIFACLVFFFFANAQDSLERKFFKIATVIKPQRLNEVKLTKGLPSNKNSKCLTYKCDENENISYCNDKSDENYVEFQELGQIEKTELIVINKFTYNEEFYIFLNTQNCKSITLEGFPLRIENTNQYLVYNNPSTDKAWKIQILKIENGNISLQDEIIFPDEIHLKKVLCLQQNEIFILDDNNQTWKTVVRK
ncbi:hypothetical protein FNW25_09410 [Flavobacterium franklandianum]|uniref:hypothetical protein n=1 Tax=Flavobacterium franklandianum TaxID=2594430 RepID=UPI001179B918|nr:hypothetical protein [Flavobacterium franklandianum]TRX25189.1 hypothetical protein FNW25_09410 [Flavobacterium franklandianum]